MSCSWRRGRLKSKAVAIRSELVPRLLSLSLAQLKIENWLRRLVHVVWRNMPGVPIFHPA